MSPQVRSTHRAVQPGVQPMRWCEHKPVKEDNASTTGDVLNPMNSEEQGVFLLGKTGESL